MREAALVFNLGKGVKYTGLPSTIPKRLIPWMLCLLVYIAIPVEHMDEANKWVKKNLDSQGGENTFVENMKGSDGKGYCLISVPDSGDYAEAMKSNFSWTTADPRVTVMNSKAPVEKQGKFAMTASFSKVKMGYKEEEFCAEKEK